MVSMIVRIAPWLIALGFAASMTSAWVIGWRIGRRLIAEPVQDPGTKFTDSTMALLGLLLGFTFSMSLTRHEHRRAMVVAESNAIGDFYTCACLLKGTNRDGLRALIREYAKCNMAVTQIPLSASDFEGRMTQLSEMELRMTAYVDQAITEGTPIAVSLTNALNNVTSSNASRLAAYRDRLPWSIVLLLFLTSVVPAFLMGQQQGAAPKVHISGTLSFIFLVTAVVFVTLDLNLPARGTITVSQEPIERLIESMNR